MRKRFLALLLAACIACTMLVVPASASSANTAVQTAVILGGLTADQTAGLNAQLTRGQLAGCWWLSPPTVRAPAPRAPQAASLPM